jgi:opacity protein-like surface antigen
VSARLALLASVALVAAAASVGADDSGSGFGLDGQFGYQDISQAKKSAEAIFGGSSGGTVWGGGLRYVLKSGFFVSGWGRSFSKDGERVFVADATSPAFPLGHPLKVHMVPIQLTIGYRAASRNSPFTPYVGIGGGVTKYHEESTVGGITDTFDETKGSGHVLAGVEVGRGSFRLAGEGGYTFVPNAVGIGGVSKVYNETGIGGFWVVGKIVFTTRH